MNEQRPQRNMFPNSYHVTIAVCDFVFVMLFYMKFNCLLKSKVYKLKCTPKIEFN